MKPIWREIIMSVIMGMILPGIVLNYAAEERPLPPEETLSVPETMPQVPKVDMTMFFRSSDGTVTEMDMDEYLVGVVLAEMPAGFEQEAKKAQAVVARTFTLKAAVTGGKHGDGSVCDKSECCQAYLSESEYLSIGGTEETVRQVRSAVLATSGYVLLYDGQLIEATYFSCSGGRTEDAVAVWGTDFPYLRSTESPGEEYALHYSDTLRFSPEELESKLSVTLSGAPESWIGMATYTAGGGINSIQIGGQTFSGTQVRSLLGLRSTAFSMTVQDGEISVVTKGFGHRVGMSQYGADAMAALGSGYEEILAHYYRGTVLRVWEN